MEIINFFILFYFVLHSSKSYRYKVNEYKPPDDYLPCYSSIRQNEDSFFILGSNEYTSPIAGGVIGGTFDFNDFVSSNFQNTPFISIRKDNIIDNICFLDKFTFIVATTSSTIEMHRRKHNKIISKQDNQTEKISFTKLLGKQIDGEPTSITVLHDNSRFIVATKRGNFECYENDVNGLIQSFNMPFAHHDEITGVSAHPEIDINWASSSSDKSCLLWDKRKMYPATPLLTNHHDRLTTVHWYDSDTIILCDSSGYLMTFDIKYPNNPICKQKVINRTINSTSFNKNNKFGVISESKKVLIYEIDDKKEVKLLEETIHPVIINSMCWDSIEDAYYVVGDDKYAKKVAMTSK